MVNFNNITFDINWIYADAYNLDSKLGGKIKISRNDARFEIDFDDINSQTHKAALYIKRDVNKGKIKQNSKKSIAWG